MKKINQKNLDVYLFLKEFIKENGYSPSYREILNGTNYKSTASIKDTLNKLYDLKFIKVKKDEKGGIITKSVKIIEDENVKNQIEELRSKYEN